MGRRNVISMTDHNSRCIASGMSASAYCRKHQLAIGTFYYWRKKVAEAPVQTSFSEITILPQTMNVIRVQFPDGTVIHIEGEVSATYLRQLAGC